MSKRSLHDIERAARNSSLTDPTWRTDYRVKLSPRCEETIMKGVPAGPTVCDRALDEHGQCDRAGDHVDG